MFQTYLFCLSWFSVHCYCVVVFLRLAGKCFLCEINAQNFVNVQNFIFTINLNKERMLISYKIELDYAVSTLRGGY